VPASRDCLATNSIAGSTTTGANGTSIALARPEPVPETKAVVLSLASGRFSLGRLRASGLVGVSRRVFVGASVPLVVVCDVNASVGCRRERRRCRVRA